MVWTPPERRGPLITAYAPVFTKDSKYFFNAAENILLLHVAATGDVVRRLAGHTAPITAIVLHPSEKKVFTSSFDGTIKTWDYIEGTLIKDLDVGKPVYDLVYNSEYKAFYTITKDKSFNLSIVDEHEKIADDFDLGDTSHTGFSQTEDEQFILFTYSRYLLVHSVQTGINYSWKHNVPITCLAVSNNNIIAIGDVIGHVFLLYDLLTQCTIKKSKDSSLRYLKEPQKSDHHWHAHGVDCVVFSPDATEFLSGGVEGAVVIWGIKSSTTGFLSKGGSLIRGISISPDGSLYTVSLLDNTIRIYNSAERTVVNHFSGFKRDPQVYRDWRGASNFNNKLLVSSERGNLQFFDTELERVVSDLEVSRNNEVITGKTQVVNRVLDFKMSSDSKHLITIDMRTLPEMDTERYLKFWELDNTNKYKMTSLVSIDDDDNVISMDISNNNDELYAVITREKGYFQLWNYAKDRAEWRCKSSGNYKKMRGECSCISTDGTLFSIGYGNIITIWNTSNAQLEAEIIQHNQNIIKDILFIPNSEFILTVSNNSIILYNISTLSSWWTYDISNQNNTKVAADHNGRIAVYLEGKEIERQADPTLGKLIFNKPKYQWRGHGLPYKEISGTVELPYAKYCEGNVIVLLSVRSPIPISFFDAGDVPVRSIAFHTSNNKGDVIVGQIAYVNAHQELFIINELDINNAHINDVDNNVKPLEETTTDGVEIVVSNRSTNKTDELLPIEIINNNILNNILGNTASHVLPSPPIIFTSIMDLLMNKISYLEEGKHDDVKKDQNKISQVTKEEEKTTRTRVKTSEMDLTNMIQFFKKSVQIDADVMKIDEKPAEVNQKKRTAAEEPTTPTPQLKEDTKTNGTHKKVRAVKSSADSAKNTPQSTPLKAVQSTPAKAVQSVAKTPAKTPQSTAAKTPSSTLKRLRK